MYNTLLTTISEGIITITINRPDKLNALNKQVINELSDVLDEVYNSTHIKAAIITGTGQKAFVAGADINEFLALDSISGSALAAYGQEHVFDKIESCPKPVVAAVNGYALGGGCELAMACHFRLASEEAKFGQPEINLGIIPGYGGTQRLTALVGKGKAMEMMMTGAMIDATEAKRWGLINHITKPENLIEETKASIRIVISKAPQAVGKIVTLVNMAAKGSTEGLQEEIEAFGELFDTADAKEGINAFLEKRRAVFTGK
jgi:enoyl-CoA hydratase